MPSDLLVASGRLVDLAAPQPAAFCLADIASGLAHTVRYRGALAGPATGAYTVAQHSVLLSRWAGLTLAEQRWALLHDAAEAYLGDLPAPAKCLPALAGYRALEHQILTAIAVQLRLASTVDDHGVRAKVVPRAVQIADRAIMAWEIGCFCTNPAWHARWTENPESWRAWWGEQDKATAALAGLVPVRDHYVWGPRDAEAQWGARAAELGVHDGE
jgi:hypothetical protein